MIRPKVAETTALGAAYAAGLAVGFWKNVDDLRANWGKDKEWKPPMDSADRREGIRAVEEGGHQDVRLGGVTRGPTDRRTRSVGARDGQRAGGREARRLRRGPGRGGARASTAGDFAEGQEEEHEHAEEGKHGDFAEGQEEDEDHVHHEGSYAEGQEADGRD